MTQSLIRAQFGPQASLYAASRTHGDRKALADLVAMAAPQRRWHVLDVATGAGHTALAFAPHVASVVAADLTPEMLAETARLATLRGLMNIETAIANAECLPFEDKSFDAVTCRLAAHHFAAPERFISEAHRVLKPGGTLLIADNISPDAVTLPGFTSAEIDAAANAYNTFEAVRDPSHVRALTVAEWHRGLGDQGFMVTGEARGTKALDFIDYAARMACTAPQVERLKLMLLDGGTALVAFLAPIEEHGRLVFSLHEAVFRACKPEA